MLSFQRLYVSHIAKNSSCLLKQHANDQVHWLPWGKQAFTLADERDVPVFLCIGHVGCPTLQRLQKEVFQDPTLGERLNQNFVCVLLDREHIPSVAELYLEFAHAFFMEALDWPICFALSTNLLPLYAVQSLPLHPKENEIGVEEFIAAVRNMWTENRERFLGEAKKLIEGLSQKVLSQGDSMPDLGQASLFKDYLYPNVDPLYGGEQGSIKSVNSCHIRFLLTHLCVQADDRSALYIHKTLDSALRGSYHDVIQGGAHRYSQSETWSDPYPEKELLENAFLAETYLVAWKATGKEAYQKFVEGFIQGMLKGASLPCGGISSHQKGQRELEWCLEDFYTHLGKKLTRQVAPFWGIDLKEYLFKKQRVRLQIDAESYCRYHKLNVEHFQEAVDAALKAVREHEFISTQDSEHPFVTSTNAAFAALLFSAGVSFVNPSWIQKGQEIIAYALDALWDGQRLYHSSSKASLSPDHIFDDYAYLCYSLLQGYELGINPAYLEYAQKVAHAAERFFGEEGGAFYQQCLHFPLFYRQCELGDKNFPCGNSLHADNLLRLHKYTGSSVYLEGCKSILRAAQPLMELYPIGHAYFYYVLLRLQSSETLLFSFPATSDCSKQAVDFLAKHCVPLSFVQWGEGEELAVQSSTGGYTVMDTNSFTSLVKERSLR